MGSAARLLSLAWQSGTQSQVAAHRLTASLLHGPASSWGNSSYLVQQWRLLAKAAAPVAQNTASARTSVQRLMSAMAERPSISIRDQWSRYQAQLSCLWAGLSVGTAGQRVLIGLLPLAIVSQLFPGKFQALALQIAPCDHTHMRPAYMIVPDKTPSLYSQLLNRTGLPTLIRQIYDEIQLWLRGIYLGLLFMPAMASAPAAFWAGGAARTAWMQLMTWTLENAGPAFIKWGQWSSTRPDLFPPDLCQAMERLQTSAPAHARAYSRARVAKSLGRPVNVLFEEFDDEPVASGSIAQIHRARLSAAGAAMTSGRYPTGTCVAVKVRHPGVTTLMQHDFVLMERAARMLSAVPGLARLRLDESIRQFGGPLKEQLDLAVEAQHLTRFKHNFRLWPNVSFPTPLYPFVSSDVLVETFEDGALISKYVNQPTYAHRFSLAETGLTCYLQMLLRDNFIHADLHPGNILVKEADVRKATGGGLLGWLRASWPRSPPKLVLLDTGMIAELSKTDQGNLISFFKALTKQDGEMLGNAILDMSEKYTCKDPEAFITEIKNMFDKLDPDFIHRHTATVIESIIDTIRDHQVTLRSAVSTVVVTTLVLEGWSSKLNPDMRILDFMRDMLLVDWSERIGRTVDNIMTNGSLAVV